VGDPAQSRARRHFSGWFLDKRSSSSLQLDCLDGLRGIAVLFVVLSHLDSNAGPFLGMDFAGSGKYGVFLFFVLSAFLLTYPMLALRPAQLGEPRRWARYAVRRVLRIFPLYVVVLLVTHAAWMLWLSPYVIPLSRAELANHLLLRAGKVIYWTVPVEFKYYLVLPFVVVGAVVVLRGHQAAGVIGAVAAVALAAFAWPGEASAPGTLALGPYLPIFLSGSAAAILQRWIEARGGVARPALKWALEGLALLAFVGVLARIPGVWATLVGQEVPRSAFHRDFTSFGLLWSVFLLAMLNGSGWIRRGLELSALRFVGVISFSVYLWHLPVLYGVVRGLGFEGLPARLGVLAGALGVAALSYLAIERPFLHSGWARRFGAGAGSRGPGGDGSGP